jgi:dihydrolipoamide dehydrogenase
VKLPFMPGRSARGRFHRRAGVEIDPEADAGDRRRHHRLEMATVYSTLGTRIDVVEMLDGMMAGADRDLVKVWEKKNAARFDNVMLKTKTGIGGSDLAGHQGRLRRREAPAEPQVYDLVLVAVGRSPNGKAIEAERRRAVTDRGFIPSTSRCAPTSAHLRDRRHRRPADARAQGVHEAHVAAEVAAGHKSYFDARQIPSVAYTDPEVAWAGLTEEQCKAQGIKYGKAVFPWAASGRAIANGRDEGLHQAAVRRATHRCIGGGIVGTHAGDLIGEVCLAVEMGCDPVDIGKTIHPHPTLCEIASAWRPKCSKACAPTCHRRRRNSEGGVARS